MSYLKKEENSFDNQSMSEIGGTVLNMIRSNAFGSLDYFRTEMELLYPDRIVQAFVRSGNALLDTVLLKSKVADPKGTVIFFNPNASVYETSVVYEDKISSFYLPKGFNVFLWNYRGYGRSTGSPTPENLLNDGKVIVDYVLKHTGMDYASDKKLILHGHSLGGAVVA